MTQEMQEIRRRILSIIKANKNKIAAISADVDISMYQARNFDQRTGSELGLELLAAWRKNIEQIEIELLKAQ